MLPFSNQKLIFQNILLLKQGCDRRIISSNQLLGKTGESKVTLHRALGGPKILSQNCSVHNTLEDARLQRQREWTFYLLKKNYSKGLGWCIYYNPSCQEWHGRQRGKPGLKESALSTYWPSHIPRYYTHKCHKIEIWTRKNMKDQKITKDLRVEMNQCIIWKWNEKYFMRMHYPKSLLMKFLSSTKFSMYAGWLKKRLRGNNRKKMLLFQE